VSELVKFLLLLAFLFIIVQIVARYIKNKFFRKLPPTEKQVNHDGHKDYKLRELISSVVIGFAVALIIHFIHTWPVIMNMEDASLDLVMGIGGFQQKPEDVPHIVILDVDEETHKEWDFPLITPRNHLKTLIETTVQAKAQLVVVDIDLSRETPWELEELSKEGTLALTDNEKSLIGEISTKFVRHPFDQSLYDYIHDYKAKCETNQENGQNGCVPIILHGVTPEREVNDNSDGLSETGFLKQAVENSAPYIQWASAVFMEKPSQPTARRALLWQPICSTTTESQTVVNALPSMALLVAAWFQNDIFKEPQNFMQFHDNVFVREKDKVLSQLKSLNSRCSSEGHSQNFPLTFTIGKLKGEMKHRIRYTIPWKQVKVPDKCDDKNEKCVFEIQQAKKFVLASNELKAKLNAKVVIIGGSYRYNRQGDIHLTPLGKMPGALLLSNTVYSILQVQGEKSEENRWENWETPLKLLIEVILVALMSIMMLYWKALIAGVVMLCEIVILFFNPVEGLINNLLLIFFLAGIIGIVVIAKELHFFRMIVSVAVITLLLLLLNVFLIDWFGQNTWLGLAIPLIAVLFHQVVDSIECCHNKNE